MFYIRLPHEGCDWTEVETLDFAAFKEAWAKAHAGEEHPCALGFARKFEGSGPLRRPVGVVYDFVIAKKAPHVSPWRTLNEGPLQ